MSFLPDLGEGQDSLFKRLGRIEWGMVVAIAMITAVGAILLYGAAGASFEPWAGQHVIRFCLALIIMTAVALMDVRVWYQLAYPAYAVSVILLVLVEVAGATAMGATRWLQVGPLRIQPSEFMKIAMVMSLARYYHDLADVRLDRLKPHLVPLAMMAVPAGLIMLQPDLGTALMVVGVSATLVILAGLSWWYIGGAMAAGLTAAVVGFTFFMSDFQKQRIFTFLDPSRDPQGTGYHITQSKIAIGSGGVFGVGYMQGTQSQLDFLPERHTDFVLAMLLEEFGFVGGVFVLALYAAAMAYGVAIARACRHRFGKFMAGGITTLIFIYVAINAGMIMGLLPVVGEPMPFLSYGGSVMLSLLFGIGLVQNAQVYRARVMGTGFGERTGGVR
jgi:rod shape determining protein RodA